ncbi:hypothetical protein V5799_019469 [Amblyomma americanum]|uniref:Uncharacterized protein n=1 Tax=Amblyomma americanum TaxID=6943 RepID=A0AAQ4EWW8_AMBAM
MADFVRPTEPLSEKMTQALNSKVAAMVALDLQPYSVVEDRGCKELLAAAVPNYRLPSRSTLSRVLVPRMYDDTRKKVKMELSNAFEGGTAAVALTSDMWTSRANESYIRACILLALASGAFATAFGGTGGYGIGLGDAHSVATIAHAAPAVATIAHAAPIASYAAAPVATAIHAAPAIASYHAAPAVATVAHAAPAVATYAAVPAIATVAHAAPVANVAHAAPAIATVSHAAPAIASYYAAPAYGYGVGTLGYGAGHYGYGYGLLGYGLNYGYGLGTPYHCGALLRKKYVNQPGRATGVDESDAVINTVAPRQGGEEKPAFKMHTSSTKTVAIFPSTVERVPTTKSLSGKYNTIPYKPSSTNDVTAGAATSEADTTSSAKEPSSAKEFQTESQTVASISAEGTQSTTELFVKSMNETKFPQTISSKAHDSDETEFTGGKESPAIPSHSNELSTVPDDGNELTSEIHTETTSRTEAAGDVELSNVTSSTTAVIDRRWLNTDEGASRSVTSSGDRESAELTTERKINVETIAASQSTKTTDEITTGTESASTMTSSTVVTTTASTASDSSSLAMATDLTRTEPVLLEVFWKHGVFNFGILDVPVFGLKPYYMDDVFMCLKTLDALSQSQRESGKAAYVVLSAVPYNAGWVNYVAEKMKEQVKENKLDFALTFLAEESTVVEWSAKTVAVVQAVAEETVAETVVADTVAEGANTVAVDRCGVVGSESWGSMGNGSHSRGMVDGGGGNSWGSVDGGDSWSGSVGGDWSSVGDGGDSWGSGVGGHSWSDMGNGGDWGSVGNGGNSWGSVDGSDSWSGGVSGHSGDGSQANSVAGSADEASEGAGGKSQDDAGADLESKVYPISETSVGLDNS